MHDLPDLPDHLRPALVEAPWKAAEAVFEHAILENVDFVLLCGDLLNPISSGACGPAFLIEQFELLRERNIAVYWATAWPTRSIAGPKRSPCLATFIDSRSKSSR